MHELYSPKFIFKHSNNIHYNTLLLTTTTKSASESKLCLCTAYLAQVLTCHFGVCNWNWKHTQHSVWSECVCVCSNQLTTNQTCHTQPSQCHGIKPYSRLTQHGETLLLNAYRKLWHFPSSYWIIQITTEFIHTK